MRERRPPAAAPARCKLVLVGDVQCGKTAMLQVLAKDCYPETYVPTVFENYTACLVSEEQRVELSLWDTSGSPYYDNVRPLCYSDSDAVLLCFDISRPETLDSASKKVGGHPVPVRAFFPMAQKIGGGGGRILGTPGFLQLMPASCPQWKTEILDYCPTTRVLLIGCKTDLRTDLSTLMELSHQKQAPISYEQGCAMARQLGAESYLECSAFTSEKSVHSIFRTVSGICLSKAPPQPPKSPARGLSKRLLHLPSRSELISSAFKKEKAKSCSVM
ncbi:rho-related GTP-binding protein Rho6 isoform X1 [Cygnus olor]|uniref:rho-related GTP-binding protein Rho6 isoform X1 n=1 Tax=Cygnus olor TaxID=8869 RepID=UPI001ADE62BF|nr:rho-related GTP-binding protein Rho6 isoform X1 [Cygnus olor]